MLFELLVIFRYVLSTRYLHAHWCIGKYLCCTKTKQVKHVINDISFKIDLIKLNLNANVYNVDVL